MTTAAELWTRLQSKRHAILERARDCSALTIPALVPPEGHDDNNVLPTPYQSVGARGVNNVASKLLMSLFPPGSAFLRLVVDPAALKELGDKKPEVEAALAVREKLISERIDLMAARPTLFEVFKHLVAAGNCLMHARDRKLRMYRLDQYVVSRKPDGTPIEAVIKECTRADALDPAVALACKVDSTKKDEKVDVYTIIRWDAARIVDWQEINGVEVPNSLSSSPIDKPSWFALRWTAVPNQDYGRSLVEEYLGDLRSLEGLSESIVQFAAAAAKIIIFVKPGSTTRFEDIRDAESGDAVVGSKADVEILQMEKYADFQVAKATADQIEIRLSHAFLLRSGTTRDAERVTAEEIRAMAQELEDVLGGVYTVQSVELQLPLAKWIMADMIRAREIEPLPEKVVKPIIVTGFQALGRNHSVNRLRAWVADVKQTDPSGGADTLNWQAINKALGVGYGVDDLDSFVLSPEEIAENQNNAMMAAAGAQAVKPVADAVAKSTVAPQ